MPMIEEADYAKLPGISSHRYASLALTVIWQALDIQMTGPWLIRQRALLIFPLALIWFADEMAERASLAGSLFKWESNPAFCRWNGWVVLILMMIVFTVTGRLYAPEQWRAAPAEEESVPAAAPSSQPR